MKPYTYECTQADGTLYQAKMRGFNRMQAAERMREARAIFTGCKGWRLVPLTTQESAQ